MRKETILDSLIKQKKKYTSIKYKKYHRDLNYNKFLTYNTDS